MTVIVKSTLKSNAIFVTQHEPEIKSVVIEPGPQGSAISDAQYEELQGFAAFQHYVTSKAFQVVRRLKAV